MVKLSGVRCIRVPIENPQLVNHWDLVLDDDEIIIGSFVKPSDIEHYYIIVSTKQ